MYWFLECAFYFNDVDCMFWCSCKNIKRFNCRSGFELEGLTSIKNASIDVKGSFCFVLKAKKLDSTFCWGQISTFWGVTKNGSEWSNFNKSWHLKSEEYASFGNFAPAAFCCQHQHIFLVFTFFESSWLGLDVYIQACFSEGNLNHKQVNTFFLRLAIRWICFQKEYFYPIIAPIQKII